MSERPRPEPIVVVQGRGVVPPGEPVVTADDLGLTRGDGCFDSARVVAGDDGVACVDGLDAHLDRLAGSAAALGIDDPGREAWAALVDEALAQWSTPGEGTLKLMLTRGREWTPAERRRPTALAVLTYRGDSRKRDDSDAGATEGGGSADEFAARRGIRVAALSRGHDSDAFTDAPWLLGGVKTLSYVVNVAAQREAADRDADDVLFVTTDGYALDGPTSGFLAVVDGALVTTPTGGTGILESTTVERIMDAARADGMPARHELVRVADLPDADGVWLVSSSRGPAPVTHLDGRELRVDPDLCARIAGYGGF